MPSNLPNPETRKEMFLASAAGMDVQKPEPITREEMFLDAISSGGGGTADAYTKAETDTLLDGKADIVDGKVPAAQLPSYVDDVLEYAGTSAFPATGESGKIYVDTTTNKTYRWSGTAYVEISESLALGETSSTAYAGNKGKANADAIAAIQDGTDIDSFGDVETALDALDSTIRNVSLIFRGGSTYGMDFNSKTTRGYYYFNGSPTNGPSSIATGFLLVLAVGSSDSLRISQICHGISGQTNTLHIRSYTAASATSGSWSAWAKL